MPPATGSRVILIITNSHLRARRGRHPLFKPLSLVKSASVSGVIIGQARGWLGYENRMFGFEFELGIFSRWYVEVDLKHLMYVFRLQIVNKSWLLMPWLLVSPGHQQPWYWLCDVGRSLSYSRKDFNCLHRLILDGWSNHKCMSMFLLKNLADKNHGISPTVITTWQGRFLSSVCNYQRRKGHEYVITVTSY